MTCFLIHYKSSKSLQSTPTESTSSGLARIRGSDSEWSTEPRVWRRSASSLEIWSTCSLEIWRGATNEITNRPNFHRFIIQHICNMKSSSKATHESQIFFFDGEGAPPQFFIPGGALFSRFLSCYYRRWIEGKAQIFVLSKSKINLIIRKKEDSVVILSSYLCVQSQQKCVGNVK